MTGKDIILKILEEDLLDTKILTVGEAAVKRGIGLVSMRKLMDEGTVRTVKIGNLDFVIEEPERPESHEVKRENTKNHSRCKHYQPDCGGNCIWWNGAICTHSDAPECYRDRYV